MTRLNIFGLLACALASSAPAQTGTPIYVYPPQQQTPAVPAPAAPLTMPSSIQYVPATAPATPPVALPQVPAPQVPAPQVSVPQVSAPSTPVPTASVTSATTITVPTAPVAAPPAGNAPFVPAPVVPVPVRPAPAALSPASPVPPRQPAAQSAGQSAGTVNMGLAAAPSRAPGLSLWGGINLAQKASNLSIGASVPVGQFRGLPLYGRGLGELGVYDNKNHGNRGYLALRGDLLAEYALGNSGAVYAGPGLELGGRRALGLTAGYRRTFGGVTPFGGFVEGQLERAWTSDGSLGTLGGLRAGVTYRF